MHTHDSLSLTATALYDAQQELFTAIQMCPPVCACLDLVRVRATATRKPNTFTATSKLKISENRLLDAIRADGQFIAIAGRFAGEVYWSDVFRDLLRARAKGLVRDVGDDRWKVA